ncbi:MAG: hypothetical protein QM820_01165 [Minicystis sp.]
MRQVLGEGVAPDLVTFLVDRAEGNAFYLEELIRAVAEGDRTTPPETVLAMVQARIERIDIEGRRVLRAASIFGETFWRGGVEALLRGTDVASTLAALAEQEVISLTGETRFPEEVEYRFRHALVREAAYGMLVESDHVLGHRLAGEWLEQAGETDAMVMAEHFERGDAAERAIPWFLRAAEQTLEGGDLDSVLTRAKRGLACGATRGARGAFLVMQGHVHAWQARYADAAQCYRDAMPDLARGSPYWYLAIGPFLHASAFIGDLDRVRELIAELARDPSEDAVSVSLARGLAFAVPILGLSGNYPLARAIVDRLGAIEGQIIAERSIVKTWIELARCHYACFVEGDPWSLRTHVLAALAHCGDTSDLYALYMIQAYDGLALIKLGRFAEGDRRVRDACELAQRRGYHVVARLALARLAEELIHRGALAEAEAVHVEAQAEARKSALRAATWQLVAAKIARQRGDFDAAAEYARESLRGWNDIASGHCADAFATLASAEIQRGNVVTARLAVTEAERRLDALGSWLHETPIRLACAEVLHAAGDLAEARARIEAARARIEARAALIDDPAFRASYLAEVPENARTLALARAWLGEEGKG